MPPPYGEGHYKIGSGVCLSVACLDLTQEWKDPGSPKLAGWKPITRVTCELIQRRSPGRLMLFRTEKPANFKLGTQTEHENPYQQKAPWHPRSKVKVARSRDVSVRCSPINRQRNVVESSKLERLVPIERLKNWLPTPRAIMRTSFNVKGQKSRWPAWLSASYLPNHIADKRHDRQSAIKIRSTVKVARSRDASDRCWPISLERNVIETPKLVGTLHTTRAIMRTSF